MKEHRVTLKLGFVRTGDSREGFYSAEDKKSIDLSEQGHEYIAHPDLSMRSITIIFLVCMLFLSGCLGDPRSKATTDLSVGVNGALTTTPVHTKTPTIKPTSSPTPTATPTPTSTPIPWYLSATETISDKNIEQLSLIESFYIPTAFGIARFDYSREKWDKRQITLVRNEHNYKDQMTLDVRDGKITHIFQDLEDPLVISSRDEELFAFGHPYPDTNPTIKLFKSTDLDGAYLVIRAECKDAPKYQGCYLYPDAFDSTGSLLISTLGIGGTWGWKRPAFPIYVWGTKDGSLISEYKGQPGQEFNFVTFNPDDSLFLVSSYGFLIPDKWELFRPNPLERKWAIEVNTVRYTPNPLASFSSNGELLAISSGGNIAILNAEDGSVLRSINVVGGTTALTFAPDSALIFAIVGKGSKVAVFDALTGEMLQSIFPEEFVRNISISPDGKYLFMTRANPGKYAQLDIYMVR